MRAIFGIIGKTDKVLINKISSSQLFRGPDSQENYINEEKLFCFAKNNLHALTCALLTDSVLITRVIVLKVILVMIAVFFQNVMVK